MSLSTKKLKKMIDGADNPFSPIEAEGYLTCFAANFNNLSIDLLNKALSIYFFDANDDIKTEKNSAILREVISDISKSLSNKTYLLPIDNQMSISSKLITLSKWTQNFVLGLNFLLENKSIRNTLNIQDIIHDFVEIGKIEEHYIIQDNEECNNYYNDISAYVISVVYQIIMNQE